MNPNRPARLNRTVLALLGLLCLAAGGVVLLVGTGLLGGVLPVPTDAPLLPPGLVLPGWAPSAVTAVTIIIGLLALRWLIAQTIRRPASSNWQLSPDTTTGTTHIDSDAAVCPLADEIEDYPGVRSATASLTGPHRDPHLYLRVSADDHADISELRRRIGASAIPRLTQALNLPALPADMLLRLVHASGARTR
ncbi:MAG TPA: alkaline shock response membrane anchor protein AmaP [Pseudonocardiaceae bacterium]|nr:alkaline shock response membrane anchor protein AmaP [Pseudonocardiaceae bacterium]